MKRRNFLFLFLCCLTHFVSYGQDPNHGELKNVTHIIVFDTSSYYYPQHTIRFGNGSKGECIREYFGPDSIKYYVDYLEPATFSNSISKGFSIEFFNSGGISNAHFHDWKGQKHGNFLLFHPNGAIKRNEVYDRGKLMYFANYDEHGNLTD